MSRQTRTLLLMLVFALGGVSALAYMAHRYGQMLEHAEDDPRAATDAPESVDVENFVAVRRAIKESIDARRGGPVDAALIRVARGSALALASVLIASTNCCAVIAVAGSIVAIIVCRMTDTSTPVTAPCLINRLISSPPAPAPADGMSPSAREIYPACRRGLYHGI